MNNNDVKEGVKKNLDEWYEEKKQAYEEAYRDAPTPLTEALRFNEGKTEYGYLLDFPRSLGSVADVCTYGATKYTRDNWKKGGKPDTEYLDAALRHLMAWKKDEKLDQESNCRHVAHAVWNLLVLMELNDG